MQHHWNDQFCSCGSDAVTCQVTGHLTCGSLTTWVKGLGNVCSAHLSQRNPETIIFLATEPRVNRKAVAA